MSRAIILPTPADPFLVSYWYKNFQTYSHFIRKLYIVVNSPSQEAYEIIAKLVKDDPKVKVLHFPIQIDHGNAINEALKDVSEDLVGLIEDDAFVVNPQAIDDAFAWLENPECGIEIVGSKRGSCSPEISDKAAQKWGLSYAGHGDQGCNFWPCFFFTRTAHLKATDRNFNGKRWEIGDSLYDLGIADDVCYGDTFVNTSLQLRSTFEEKQIHYVPQYHASPEDLIHSTAGKGIFDGQAPWMHIGSLSSGFSGLLRNQQGIPLSNRKEAHAHSEHTLPNAPTNEFEQWEYERRVQIWQAAYDSCYQDIEISLSKDYLYAIENVIMQFQLKPKRIRQRREIYQKCFNL